MAKYYGRFTKELTKILKKSDRVMCQLTEDGAIYISNGYVAAKMTAYDYDYIVRPAVMTGPGNWQIKKGEQKQSADFNIQKAMDRAAKEANGGALTISPIVMRDNNFPVRACYAGEKDFITWINPDYLTIAEGLKLSSAGKFAPAVQITEDGTADVLIMPVNYSNADRANKAVRAYYTE